VVKLALVPAYPVCALLSSAARPENGQAPAKRRLRRAGANLSVIGFIDGSVANVLREFDRWR
jgi:hypothetical protein